MVVSFVFHPDHLGSTSYITTQNGSISQHVEYIAFGEVLFEEHSSSFSSPYLFNGKELDRETNLSYYGARYLDMKTSLWLSVDEETENDLSVSAYVYSFNNPVNFIDPDGNWPDPPTWKSIKAYWSYQINTKIPNDWKNIKNEMDNGWRAEKYLRGGRQGGMDFRSDLKNGETYGRVPKGRGFNNTEVVDVTGLDILTAYVGLSTGTKRISTSGKIVDVFTDVAKAIKSTPDGWSLGQDTGEMFNKAKDQVTMKLEDYFATGTEGWNKSEIKKNKSRDTTVVKKDSVKINSMNRKNYLRAKEQKNANNKKLQERINYYKQ